MRVLCIGSEKAAAIARKCRTDEALLRLLVEKKKDKTVNGVTFDDFKTLADVLIQESIKHDVLALVKLCLLNLSISKRKNRRT